mmetsp:Transcript_2568/g.9807  ORF Transcript_2568/g.9807 Transcript_2568/m.9807 type:complete len:124 (-) Transcript_2568:626-997(-)
MKQLQSIVDSSRECPAPLCTMSRFDSPNQTLLHFHNLLTHHLLSLHHASSSHLSQSHSQLHKYLQYKHVKDNMTLLYGVSMVYASIEAQYEREKLFGELRRILMRRLWRFHERIGILKEESER